jgi:hypothetical protein
MNLSLGAEELNWLRTMRDARPASNPTPNIPARVALRLRFLGLMAPSAAGEYTITGRGREELVEWDRHILPPRRGVTRQIVSYAKIACP